MDEKANSVKIAVLESKIEGLREQQKAHAIETKLAIAELSKDVRDLVAVMNRGRGAFGFAMILSGSLGASAAAFVQMLFKQPL